MPKQKKNTVNRAEEVASELESQARAAGCGLLVGAAKMVVKNVVCVFVLFFLLLFFLKFCVCFLPLLCF